MGSAVPDSSNVISYAKEDPPDEGFRILGLTVVAGFGIVAAIVFGVCVGGMIANFVQTQPAFKIACRVAGAGFLVAAAACALTVVDLRRKKVWFLRGFIVGAGVLFLIIGSIFLLHRPQ